jgi:hypothetical protein
LPNLHVLATCCVRLELRPLPSTGITRLQRYYEPLRHPQSARPVRHRRPVGRPRPRLGASRVACAFLVYVLSPLPRRSHWRSYIAHPSSGISLPRKGCRVGLRIGIFEACSAFTRVTARTLALPPIRGTLTRRLQPFRYLHDCSGCFRLERLPGGTCTHWKSAALSRRTPTAARHGMWPNVCNAAGRSRRHWLRDPPDPAATRNPIVRGKSAQMLPAEPLRAQGRAAVAA